MVYLVTYDLNKQGKNYDALYTCLREYSYIRDLDLDSVWFISTTQDASQIDADIRQHMDANDRLFVTRLHKGEYQGWMDKKIWEWINSNL